MKKFNLKKYVGYESNYQALILDIWYQNNKIVAYVEGSEIYKIEITLRNNCISNYYCSCPSSRGGMSFCKHLSSVENYLKKREIPELESTSVEKEVLDFNLSTNKILRKFQVGIKKFLDKDNCINCYQSEEFCDFVFKYCIYIDTFLEQRQPNKALELIIGYIDYIETIFIYNADDLDDINEILINYLEKLAIEYNFYDNIKEYLQSKYQDNSLNSIGEEILDKIIPTITTKEDAKKFISLLKNIKIDTYQESDINNKIKILKSI